MMLILQLCFSLMGILSQIFHPVSTYSENWSPCKDPNQQPYDPDQCRDTRQLITSRGYRYEEHEIRTKDGYILTCFRIIHPMLMPNQTGRSVLLQHGLLSSSRDYLINSPGGDASERSRLSGNNLGFELAKRGYDVWLLNSRGNEYSQKHVSLTPSDSKFWDFSYADMAKWDIPACVDYVLAVTGRKDVAYVGYSQGTMIMWGALSLYPRLNEVVKPIIQTASVMSLQHVTPALRALARAPILIHFLEHYAAPFLPNAKILRDIEEVFCKPPLIPVCLSIVGLAGGYDEFMINKTRMDVYSEGVPAGTSNKNLVLYAQNIRSKRFADYDYGHKKNMEVYGTSHPPEFPIESITSPHIAMISGLNDFLAPPKDVDVLRQRLKVTLFMDYVIEYEKWSHFDFAIGLESWKYVNRPILDVLGHYDRILKK